MVWQYGMLWACVFGVMPMLLGTPAAEECWDSDAQLVAKIYNINPHPHWEIFLGLLCFLFTLHVYWCALRLP